MKSLYSNATVVWDEFEIVKRESLIREIPILLQSAWRELNPKIQFIRCETPVLTPEKYLKSHIENKFKGLKYLRVNVSRVYTSILAA